MQVFERQREQRFAVQNWPRIGLTECIGCGCLSPDRCKLANAAIGTRYGPGPRYWVNDPTPLNLSAAGDSNLAEPT